MTNTDKTVSTTVGTTLNFLASVIKSGEPWTATCQAEFDKAHAALRAASIAPPAPERSKEEVWKLADARRRMQEKLDYFDAEVAEELANENERADLWTDIEVLVDDLRTVLSALEPASLHKGEAIGWMHDCGAEVPFSGEQDETYATPNSRENKE